MTKVVHCKKNPEYDVYIGRGSIYGNPFSHRTGTQAKVVVGSREEAVEKYKQWINGEIEVKGVTPPTKEQIMKLKDKIIACWCTPLACHGDVLAEMCNKTS